MRRFFKKRKFSQRIHQMLVKISVFWTDVPFMIVVKKCTSHVVSRVSFLSEIREIELKATRQILLLIEKFVESGRSQVKKAKSSMIADYV